ncbi:MAG: response regulator, partial [Proteobacteria bacterium]
SEGATAQNPLPLENLRLLLADDSADNRLLITRLLGKAGAVVDTAANGRDAYDMALESDYAAVLMDIQMPEMDGYEATKLLRSAHYKKPIIALTAHAMAEDHARSLEAGCSAHLTKPISRVDLISTILRLVDRT